MLSCTSSHKFTRRKNQRVPKNLGNPKNGQTVTLFGIHRPGTELLNSRVRTEFSTRLFQVVFIWLSTEIYSGSRDQQV